MRRLLATIAIAGLCGSAHATDYASAGSALRQRLEDCVASASLYPFLHGASPQLSVEQAFAACQTEQDAIRALLASTGTAPAVTEAGLATVKLRIKAKIAHALEAGR